MKNGYVLPAAIAATMMLAGCAGKSELRDHAVFSLEKRNIIERDLTVPAGQAYTVPELIRPKNVSSEASGDFFDGTTGAVAAGCTVVSEVEQPRPQSLFIEFENESTTPPFDAAKRVAEFVGDDGPIWLVGHSHGRSQIGVQYLSAERAVELRQLLIEHGVDADRIKTLAMWSKNAADSIYKRGVQVLVVDDPFLLAGI